MDIRALGVSAALLCAACASVADAPPAPAAPSPRAECAAARAAIYFTENSATVQPLSVPLLRELLLHIDACRAAGGELRAINVTSYPDHHADRQSAEAQVRERNRRVRNLLIELGAPADKIVLQRAPRSSTRPVMTRRAVVTLDLY